VIGLLYVYAGFVVYICSRIDDDYDNVNDVITGRASSSTTARLRRTSVPLYGRANKNDESGDESDSVRSLHRDPQRHRMLTWRDQWQPASANRLPAADGNNNGNSHCKTRIVRVPFIRELGVSRRKMRIP